MSLRLRSVRWFRDAGFPIERAALALASIACGCGDASSAGVESCWTSGAPSIDSALPGDAGGRGGNSAMTPPASEPEDPGTSAPTGGVPPEPPGEAETPPVEEPPAAEPPEEQPSEPAEEPEREPPGEEPAGEEPPVAEPPPPEEEPEPPETEEPPEAEEPPPEEPPVEEPPPEVQPVSLCLDSAGAAIPYDYSFGLSGEYAFELTLDCSIGGFIAPLVDHDPIGLTGIDAYVATLSDWFRASILLCADTETVLSPGEFGLVPNSQASGLSRADFEAAIALFLMVLSRHDDLPDGFSPQVKQEVQVRLEALDAAVELESEVFTRPSLLPECSLPEGEGGEPNP